MNLNIFMKSGNVIYVDNVEEYEVRDGFHGMSFFSIKQSEDCQLLLNVTSLSLEQVEAIVEVHDDQDL